MARRPGSILALCLLTSFVIPAIPASSSETVTYAYDERGRLVQVSRSGSVNNGVAACYTYDRGDNRSNVTVVTSGACTAGVSIPSFSIGNASATEGGTLVFTVTKSGAASGSHTVSYASASGTATSGSDFTAVSGQLSFAAAETTKTISVTTTNDIVVEGAENFTVNLTSASGGATITANQGTGTIADNDNPPSFSVADVSVTEGGSLVFTVTKTGSATVNYSVSYATTNGTAVSGSDYTAASGTLIFAANETTKTISVPTVGDTAVESNETVFLNLSGATGGAAITDSQAVGTIVDNDTGVGPSFSVNDAGADEGFGITFTITKTGSTSSSHSVNYATSNNGSAIAGTTTGTDYNPVSGTVTFTSSQTTKTVVVQTWNDPISEGIETFLFTLSGPTGGAVIGDGQGVGSIHNIDEPDPGICYDEFGMVIPCGSALQVLDPGTPAESSEAPSEPPDQQATEPQEPDSESVAPESSDE